MNHNLYSTTFKAALCAVLAAALSACGGGGDDSPSPPGSGNDAIDKYVGTFVTPCGPSEGITVSGTGAALNSRILLTVQPKSSATKAPTEIKVESYAAADCSGTALNTVTVKGDDSFLQMDGTATIGSDTVDKTTTSVGPFFPGFSGASIVVNGVAYDGALYGEQTATVEKDIFSLKGSDLYTGDVDQPLDGQGYPTVLETDVAFTKQ